ncbi:hypothetical protein JIN85_14685 [Luteolibacter pohnpeiensis]|uniref:Uncharacterized protein n=1 Tax=Luteolibacter pohnpeiensis TaxID=454153 RepID=A0A934S976_9BACT|nr:hypothetical protein [Luteolibacter pohnpeiensis]MBK1883665.1 hypothetical protein [Luteolibacter pohnpeiensis]
MSDFTPGINDGRIDTLEARVAELERQLQPFNRKMIVVGSIETGYENIEVFAIEQGLADGGSELHPFRVTTSGEGDDETFRVAGSSAGSTVYREWDGDTINVTGLDTDIATADYVYLKGEVVNRALTSLAVSGESSKLKTSVWTEGGGGGMGKNTEVNLLIAQKIDGTMVNLVRSNIRMIRICQKSAGPVWVPILTIG